MEKRIGEAARRQRHERAENLRSSVAVESFAVGDKFTIAGLNEMVADPSWRWWTFWRPKKIVTNQPKIYRIMNVATSEKA